MSAINYDKHIWEGWKVIDFINELKPQLDMIMKGDSWQKPLIIVKTLLNGVLIISLIIKRLFLK